MIDMPDNEDMEAPSGQRILNEPVEHEMKKAYIDYAMSVIVGRALPDVRDGLKPVHRRILYAMNDMGLYHNRPHKKSARVVGEVLGKYHPHGESAVYDALVRMAQPFSLRYTLVDGQGNFGSVDGDTAAAMRYTECRLDRISSTMLQDIDKETVDFVDNFDGSLKEPLVLPAILPNLLVNGSSGIAVGMATNMPPHNLSEVVDAIIMQIEDPDVPLLELMSAIKGPDFPTGGIIYGRSGILRAYSTGRGTISVRARTEIEEMKNGKHRIVVTEIPYMVNKSRLLESIASLVKEREIDGITDLRDESDRSGMRIVIELRADVMEEIVLNQLFARTQLKTTFGINNLCLVNGEPKTLPLKSLINYYIEHRKDVITRRTQYLLKKAEERAVILDGLLIALDNLDEVIKLIRKAKTADEAKTTLIARFLLKEVQAKAILDMKLQKLTGMERQSVKDEYEQVKKEIADYKDILAREERVLSMIKEELISLKEKYGDERKTEIVDEEIDIEIEDLIPEEDVVITITRTGYIKRIPVDTYQQQRRGGVGLRGMTTKEEDDVVDMFVASSHSYIMFFSNHGKVYWLKAYRIPEAGRHAKGRAIINLLPKMDRGERIVSTIHVREFSGDRFLLFTTKKGRVKKTPLEAYSRPRSSGIIAIALWEDDELIDTRITDGDRDILIATKYGKAIRFHESEVRPMGRNSHGVVGIRLRGDDEVVSTTTGDDSSILLSITENGYGKLSWVRDYRRTHRGSYGVITIKVNERNGPVKAVLNVGPEDELIVTSKGGMIIRIPVSELRVMGRATQGVRIMRLRSGDAVSAVARMAKKADDDPEDENIPEDGQSL